MAENDDRRHELGGFLRIRRKSLIRSDFDLPPVRGGRLRGLRREEISYLAGLSVTWYAWLEQGRDINPSRQVLDSIARNLRLSAPEHDYVLSLAGYAPGFSSERVVVPETPSHIQHLLEVQDLAPAFAISPSWDIAGWNAAYQALYPNVATFPPRRRNLLRAIFTDPYVRKMLPDWEITSRQFVAEYRTEAGPLLGHPTHVALVSSLMDVSSEFATVWREHGIRRFTSRERVFFHPMVDRLSFEHHRLLPADHPDLHVVIYLPNPETDTREAMATLLASQ